MKLLIKIGIVAAIIGAVVALVPAIKGPFNRIRNEANEKLNDEYVVDNYKVEYVKLNDKKVEIKHNIDKFNVEQKVVAKKLENNKAKLEAAKKKLKEIGTSDLAAFNRAKDIYESLKLEHENLVVIGNVYSNTIVKLETSLALVEENMRKAKSNVDVLSTKKALVESVKGANDIVANLQGIGEDASLGIALEKLDETALRESIKLEALSETSVQKSSLSEADAKAYLEALK